MSVRYLTEEDVHKLVDMEMTLEVIEEAFRQLGMGTVHNVPRTRARGKGIILHSMSATAMYLNYVGQKSYTTTREGARFWVTLYHAQSGEMRAILEANRLGQLRTGAASGIATKYLSNPHCNSVGLFGTGFQARTQLEGICHVRPIERIEVFSRNQQKRNEFALEMETVCNAEVVPVTDSLKLAERHSILVTGTTSAKPLFSGEQVPAGCHLNVVGSNWLKKTEIDIRTVEKSDLLVCDARDACEIEAGDFIPALTAGSFRWDDLIELQEIITEQHPGRTDTDQITLFKSVGLAIQDVALAARVLSLAEEEDLGTLLPINGLC